MTLEELSVEYACQGRKLSGRIRVVRRLLRDAGDEELRWQLERRLQMLLEMQRSVNWVAQTTAHYYEREEQRHG